MVILKSLIAVNINKFPLRYLSSKVRVRFAPSPTGNLHLGGLRTALYNYLFAKKHLGKFILRIEDTDRTRLVPGAVNQIIDNLVWAGIKIDEGPGTHNLFGPYIQSDRLNIYREYVAKLLKTGDAYYCFCSEKRLELLRKQAARNREISKYDNRCRALNQDEAKIRVERGDEHCIRFKLNSDEDCCNFDDLIYGSIKYDVTKNEGDPVIMKSDGYPTYHIANVIDDHLMKISHVLRGVEWQISTSKHLMMYKAFGWTPPKFGHLPLLVDATGNKLSKRMDDTTISFYKNSGIFPDPLINFVFTSGGGFEEDEELRVSPKCYTMSQLIMRFNLSSVKTSPGRLNIDKLNLYNRMEIEKRLKNKEEKEELIKLVQNLARKKFKEKKDVSLQINHDHVTSILDWSKNRINTVQDLMKDEFSFLWIIPESTPGNLSDTDVVLITQITEELEGMNVFFSKSWVSKYLKEKTTDYEVEYGSFMKLLRIVLSGLKVGPSVAEMMEILGKENSILRMRLFLDKVKSLQFKKTKC